MNLNLFKKSPAELEKNKILEKKFLEKVQSLKEAIEKFKSRFGIPQGVDFILGNKLAAEFEEDFKAQLQKSGSSATKRWCWDAREKLHKIDVSNIKFRVNYPDPNLYNPRPLSEEEIPIHLRPGQGLPNADEKYYKAVQAQIIKNVKEFKKIFYNTTVFDSDKLGTKVKVKGTFSQNAAINQVKKELNELYETVEKLK